MSFYMGCQQSSSHLTAFTEQTKMTSQQSTCQLNKSLFISAGLLGEGGFGKVFAGMFVKNSQWYAVKEIKKSNLVKHKSGVDMLFGEVDAMKRMNHSFVINLHAAFHDKLNCYLVLDLKTGGDLRYYLRKRILFEERDAVFLVACLTSALEHIHSRNIIHRDIKPENIIFDEKGYPYLTDFGVAYMQPSSPASTILSCTLASGTKQYLAPEVFTKVHVQGPEMDYWSLGVIVYEMLFGKRPFEKHCPVQMIQYLEKGLHEKKRKLKQQQQQQQMHEEMLLDCLASSLPHIDTNHSFRSSSTESSPKSFISPSPYHSPCQSLDHNHPSWMLSQQMTQSTRAYNSSSPGHHYHNNNQGSSPSSVTMSPSKLKKHCSFSSTASSSSSLSPSFSVQKDHVRKFPDIQTNSPHTLLASPSPTTFTKSLFQQSNNNNTYANRVDIEDAMEEEELNEEDDYGEEEVFERAWPGDHWLVDDGNLPASLVVSIPIANPWLGPLSNECLEVMHGLLECRPSHRLGCRNLAALVHSKWLTRYQLHDQEMLLTRRYTPNFQPGRRFLKETMKGFNEGVAQAVQDCKQQQQKPLVGPSAAGVSSSSGSSQDQEELLSTEQEQQFEHFAYTHASFARCLLSPPSSPSSVSTITASSWR